MFTNVYDCQLKRLFIYFFSHCFLWLKRNREPMWPSICHWLKYLKKQCDNRSATFNDLKVIISNLFFYFNKSTIIVENNWKHGWMSVWYGQPRKADSDSELQILSITKWSFYWRCIPMMTVLISCQRLSRKCVSSF